MNEIFWENIIGGESKPKHSVNGPIFPEILKELSTYSIDGLSSNIQQLRLKEKQLQADVEKLAAEHYSVFLAKTDASHDILKKNASIDLANNALLNTTSTLVDSCQNFLRKAQLIELSLKSNAKALDKHTQLLELIELPQIMQTSVQNGYYDDAIAILMHSKKLVNKHGSDISILRTIDSQIRLIGSRLVHQLCDLLKSPLSLPACIKIIVLLRRTGVFSEQELRLKFLQARSACLQQQLTTSLLSCHYKENSSSLKTDFVADPAGATSGSAPTSVVDPIQQDAYWTATRRIEITRVQLFDTATQYRAVFPEESDLLHHNSKTTNLSFNPTSLSSLTNPTSINPLILPANMNWATSSNLFHTWLVYQITGFLKRFSQDLGTMLHQQKSTSQSIMDSWSKTNLVGLKDNAEKKNNFSGNHIATLFTQLQSLISQTMYFGRSFTRIGCDFRPHLSVMFSHAVELFVKTYIENSVAEFSLSLDYLLWQIIPSTSDLDSVVKPSEDPKTKQRANLLEHPPLVLLYNQLRELFHGLFVCCPVCMKQKVIIILSSGLHSAAKAISTTYQTHSEHEKLANWQTEALNLATKFCSTLVPLILSDLVELLFDETDSNRGCNPLIREIQHIICAPLYGIWPQLNPFASDLAVSNSDPTNQPESITPDPQSTISNGDKTESSNILVKQTCPRQSDSLILTDS